MFRSYLFIVVIVLTVIANSATAGPVAHWSFDEDSGNTAYNTLGNTRHGTIVGAERRTHDAMVGGSLLFNDFSDRVELGDLFGNLGTGDFTISMWVKELQQMPGNTMPVLMRQRNDWDANASWINLQRDRRGGSMENISGAVTQQQNVYDRIYIYDDVNHRHDNGDPPQPGDLRWQNDGQWHHIVFGRYDKAQVMVIDRHYYEVRDGYQNLEVDLTGYTSSLGAWLHATNGWIQAWDGYMDEVTFYDSWIGTHEAYQLYDNPGLVIGQNDPPAIPAPLALIAMPIVLLCHCLGQRSKLLTIN